MNDRYALRLFVLFDPEKKEYYNGYGCGDLSRAAILTEKEILPTFIAAKHTNLNRKLEVHEIVIKDIASLDRNLDMENINGNSSES